MIELLRCVLSVVSTYSEAATLSASLPTLAMETTDDYYYSYDDSTDATVQFRFNISLDCPDPGLPGASVILPLVYALIFLVGVVGNVLVVAVVGGGRRPVDTFVVNLALADLVFVFTLPLWAASAASGDRWGFGNLLCKLSSFVIAVNRFSNISFLTCMSVDRYLVVVRLLDSRYLGRDRCVRAACAAIWAVSLALGTPYLVYRRVELVGGEPSCVEDSGSRFFLGLGLLLVLLTFVVPAATISVCYGSIIARLSRHRGPRGGARLRHSVKMVASVVVAFLASWLPYNVFKVLETAERLTGEGGGCGGAAWRAGGLRVSCCLAFANSCANPAIYFWLDRHFRRRAEVVLRACAGGPRPARGADASTTGTSAGTSPWEPAATELHTSE